jgi:Mg/Co/Ni transporter MgtE
MAPRIKRFSEELVKDAESLIVSDPASVREGVEVFAAVEAILEDPRTLTVYVVDKKYRLKGILVINDLLKVSAIQMTPKKKKTMINIFKYMSLLYSETVNDIMRKPVSIRMDDKIINALQLMEKHNLIDLPVVDGNNKLIGELSGLEILTVLREKINCGELEKLK